MITKKTKTEEEEMLLASMEIEFDLVLGVYKDLLKQCRALAISMGYQADHVIGKIMPKTRTDREDTCRLLDWFHAEKSAALKHTLKLAAERERECSRNKLLESLGLTPEQMELLGIQED
jgi:hypothetical protein